jgi:hypothetical protein
MFGHWRGAYEYGALAAAGDFITLMSYDQHSRYTPPGPVAGMPWVQATLDFVLAQGVPPEKILLGIPAYSRHWRSTYEGGEQTRAQSGAEGLGYGKARELARARDAELAWDRRQKVYHAPMTGSRHSNTSSSRMPARSAISSASFASAVFGVSQCGGWGRRIRKSGTGSSNSHSSHLRGALPQCRPQ